ncbi:MAG: DEAD/DEAH box helicase family protein [Bacteroidetes bacterium]|nr:DEAD/DEAH box helicase family protein [Bacteroidota bacterium]
MLLDNKTKTDDNDFYKVFDFIKNYTKQGELDLVTGYFSVNALALMYDDLNNVEKFKMILGNLMKDNSQVNKIIDLLNGNAGIDNTLSLSLSAKKAVAFLEQEHVEVKNIQKNFCHAKTYIYTDKDPRKNFYIIGSSNLTDAGLGIKDSSNVELNTAKHDYEGDFKEFKNWFKHQWEKVASEKIELADRTKVEVKDYIIELIKNLFKEYTPKDLYYKVLYELFKEDLLSLTSDAEFKREIAHLEVTEIYQTLFSYQQKGSLSLIKMLQKYNGAILADAVGLGKTWTALAVMKYFENKGYTVFLFCPKKLRNNWEQYQSGKGSRFEKDEIEYYVRNHTDLQDERLTSNYPDFPLSKLQRKQKLLFVIDESHNLRNDKSSRYKFLVDNVLLPEKTSREVKLLHLSATPINNKLIDIRNQFKLMTKGSDSGFEKSGLEIGSLESIFRTAQKDFNDWSALDTKKISDFISKLPQKFFDLTDALIVARTRKLIEGEFGAMNFPKKDIPVNEYITPVNFGNLKSFEDILNALRVNLTAYRPSEYIKDLKVESVLDNPKQREKFLVKMMYILLMKRLESSWFSFKNTVENILNHHTNALAKVNEFIEKKVDTSIEDNLTEEEKEELEDSVSESENNSQEEPPITLGKKNPIPLSSITNIDIFKKHLEGDITKLELLQSNLAKFESDFANGKAEDEKLNKLIYHIETKQAKSSNKKVLIFTVFKDTAQYLYRELQKRKIKNLAYVSGALSETHDGYSGEKFEEILERFAPFTKLYNEKDWTELYENNLTTEEFREGDKWKVPFEKWLQLIKDNDKKTQKKISNPIDVLIATDCLSEGQNLQDCDTVVNYDIHWNPVRLIQRMGRIDRIGSMNDTIRGINFWPGKNYEDYLRLKKRVEERMALMSVVGTELQDITPEFQKMVEENPLLPKQAQKMLDQLQITWDDIETNDETLGLNDLSMEQFRQELFEFFKQNEDFFKQMPNGVFTGFKFRTNKKWETIPDSIVAVLGYPRKPDESTEHIYDEIHLLHQPISEGEKADSMVLKNNQEILSLLRYHKMEHRYVPQNIEKGDQKVLAKLAASIGAWVKNQTTPVAINEIQNLFTGDTTPQKISPEQKKLEDKFKSENFDLINWFIISNK